MENFGKKRKRRLSVYGLRMIAATIFFLLFFALLAFYFRIFEAFKRTPVVSVNSTGIADQYSKVTYIVDDVEYVSIIPRGNFDGKYIYYKVKDPNVIMFDRTLWLTLFASGTAITAGIMISCTVLEVKKKKRK